METRLKYAIDVVMDAFDDAVLNVPGESRGEKVGSLLNHLLPRLIERGAYFGQNDPNPDLDSESKAALMKLLQHVLVTTPNIAATVVIRVMEDGTVRASGGSKNLRDGAVEEMADICRLALSELAKVRMGNKPCDCPACRAKSSTFMGGPKAEA